MTHWKLRLLGRVGIGIAAITAGFAHYTWIAPAAAPLEVGKPGFIRFCHGHEFPYGEETLGTKDSQAIMVPPSGKQTKLSLLVEAKQVVAAYTPQEPGLHRAVYTQDRGVLSRTPNGVKRGGRDTNPDAAQTFRSYRSAVAYLSVGKSGKAITKPAGIELEIVAIHRERAWELQLVKSGKPQPGVPIQILIEGSQTALEGGKTDAAGRLTYRPDPKAGRPMLFSAEWKDAPPAGVAYDSVNYATSLYVTQ